MERPARSRLGYRHRVSPAFQAVKPSKVLTGSTSNKPYHRMKVYETRLSTSVTQLSLRLSAVLMMWPIRLSAAYDYEYERNGVSSLFMLFAPLDGWRRVEVRERRTKVDWAHVIKKLVDEDYPDRDRIVLVMDNLLTSCPRYTRHSSLLRRGV